MLVRVALGVQLEELLVRELPHVLFIHLSVDLGLSRPVEVHGGGRDYEKVHRGERREKETLIENLRVAHVKLLEAEEAEAPQGGHATCEVLGGAQPLVVFFLQVRLGIIPNDLAEHVEPLLISEGEHNLAEHHVPTPNHVGVLYVFQGQAVPLRPYSPPIL